MLLYPLFISIRFIQWFHKKKLGNIDKVSVTTDECPLSYDAKLFSQELE